MVVRGERERLVPFIRDEVVTGGPDAGVIEVDWTRSSRGRLVSTF